MNELLQQLGILHQRLSRIEQALQQLVTPRVEEKWFTVDEAAEYSGYRASTIRKNCNNRRIQARKQRTRRGAHALWIISKSALDAFMRGFHYDEQ